MIEPYDLNRIHLSNYFVTIVISKIFLSFRDFLNSTDIQEVGTDQLQHLKKEFKYLIIHVEDCHDNQMIIDLNTIFDQYDHVVVQTIIQIIKTTEFNQNENGQIIFSCSYNNYKSLTNEENDRELTINSIDKRVSIYSREGMDEVDLCIGDYLIEFRYLDGNFFELSNMMNLLTPNVEISGIITIKEQDVESLDEKMIINITKLIQRQLKSTYLISVIKKNYWLCFIREHHSVYKISHHDNVRLYRNLSWNLEDPSIILNQLLKHKINLKEFIYSIL